MRMKPHLVAQRRIGVLRHWESRRQTVAVYNHFLDPILLQPPKSQTKNRLLDEPLGG